MGSVYDLVASSVDSASTTVAVNGIDIEDIAGKGMMNEREDIAEGTVGRATLAPEFLFLTLAHHYMYNFSPVVYARVPLAPYTCQMHCKAKEASWAKAMFGTSKLDDDSSPLDLEIELARVRYPTVLDHSLGTDRNFVTAWIVRTHYHPHRIRLSRDMKSRSRRVMSLPWIFGPSPTLRDHAGIMQDHTRDRSIAWQS